MHNLITLTDSYKFSHYRQYPEGTKKVYSYFESRVGAKFKETVFFGLQYFLRHYLEAHALNEYKIKAAKELCDKHMGPGLFNEAGWKLLLQKHDGRLPIRIRAVPEGSVVPVSNVLMTIENTDDEFPWITNYLETLLVQVWYACTVATQSREMKKIILKYLEETGDPAGINFKLHDFGFRGVSSVESAGLGGAAHLVNFMGTDTVRGLEIVRDFYAGDIAGFSIPASEHSTITSWGRDGEEAAMRNMLTKYPTGLVACVSDSWDIQYACENIWGGALADLVRGRAGTLVVRPDSGDPRVVLPQILKTLGEKLGEEKNAKGYKVLSPQVRVIQGDGITFDSIEEILQAVKDAGYSADNLAFGSGGGLLQMLNRDTQRFAFKCSAIQIHDEWKDVYKSPATDPTKNSKRGRVSLFKTENGFETGVYLPKGEDAMETVFENGVVKNTVKFSEVRERAAVA
jgi:nicotinamide phosphoribosyltransferase